MSRRRRSPGFTLIELVVAMVLSGIVLMGSFSLMTNMVTAEVNGMRNGTVSTWSLAGITAMNTDIAGSGALAYPAPGNADDYLVVCTNWASKPGGYFAVVQKGLGNSVYSYCYDTTDVAPSPFAKAILRNVVTNAPNLEACLPAPPVPCSSGVYGADSIVATGVYRSDALTTNTQKVFTADPNTLNAVRLQFVVGNPAANAVSAGGNNGTVTPVAVSVPFNTEIILED